MGAGGIIQNRAAVLLTAVTDPSFYESLSDEDRECVNAILSKPFSDRTKQDVIYLAHLIRSTVGHQ